MNKFYFNMTAGLAIVGALLAQLPALAHEYWIEPINFTPALSDVSASHLKVGSDLKGQLLSYIPQFTVGFQVTDANGTRKLNGRVGDRPALVFQPEQAGLNIITYQTTKNRVTFDEWEVFETYLVTQGMSDVIEQHRARSLPDTDFSESYSRYVKSLIAVDGDVSGSDLATGMLIELVALQNPYALAPGEDLSVQLLYLGASLKDTQISIFSQDQERNGPLNVERVRTDENGQIDIQLQPGQMYVLNSIKLVPVEGQDKLVWESFWASLTFEAVQ